MSEILEQIATLKQQAVESARRHDSAEIRVETRFESIIKLLGTIKDDIHDIKTKVQVFQSEIDHQKSDCESGKIRVQSMKEEISAIGVDVLRLQVDRDILKEEVGKWNLTTMCASVGAIVAAVGSFVYHFLRGDQ